MLLLMAVAAALAIVVHFHDQFWWPPDEGVYAYVADRIVSGDVLYRDVQDLHAGYVQLANAAAFRVWGADLVSLRYPLALATVAQTVLVFLLLRPRGALMAFSAALAAAALTFVQFLNPTANWYALFVAVLATMVLAWPTRSPARLVSVGFLLGALFLVRQLSGVLFAIGALTYLLYQAHATAAVLGQRAVLARSLVAVMTLGLASYLVANAELFGALLFGLFPLLILVWAFRNLKPPDRVVAQLIGWLFAGALLAVAPLVIYLGSHGAIVDWLRDSFATANRMTKLEFISASGYLDLLLLAVGNVVRPVDGVGVVNGLFWICLIVAPVLVGGLTLRHLRRPAPFASTTLVHPFVLTVPFLRAGVGALPDPGLPLLHRCPVAVGAALACRRVARPAPERTGRCGGGAEHDRPVVAGRPTAVARVGWDRRGAHGGAGCACPLPKASLRIEAHDYTTYRNLLELDRPLHGCWR